MSTSLSATYMTSLTSITAGSSLDTSQALTTQQTGHPEASILPTPPASSQSSQTPAWQPSSLMPPSPDLNMRLTHIEQEWMLHLYKQSAPLPMPKVRHRTSASRNGEVPHISNNQSPTRVANRWNAALPPATSPSIVNKYPANLTSIPSPLHPPCLTAERL